MNWFKDRVPWRALLLAVLNLMVKLLSAVSKRGYTSEYIYTWFPPLCVGNTWSTLHHRHKMLDSQILCINTM